MKFKKIIVPNYIFRDELGEFMFHNVTLLVEVNSLVKPESFNQQTNDYSISSSEVEKLEKEAAQRYFNDKYTKVLKGEHKITHKEFNGIKLFLNVNGSELAKLLNLDKSSISRIINRKQPIQTDTMLLIMEKLGNELDRPGTTKRIIEKLKGNNDEPLKDLSFPAEKVAEWIIRRFAKLEECVTNLKLQKLLYYAQGIGLGRYHTRIIKEDFYAWEHGPVVQEVYRKYKSSGSNALEIDSSVDITDLIENNLVTDVLNETMGAYGKYAAWVLRDKTHGEPPWADTQPNQKIEIDKMRDFFSNVVM